MFRCTIHALGGQRRWWKEGRPDFSRAAARRLDLERRRLEMSRRPPPSEPTSQQACILYRQLLKAGREHLRVTDGKYYMRKVRHEFEVTARQTSGRVRGIMYERGLWMLKNKLGGVV
ncbi:putative Complex 1 protein (LYR family) [Trypanosoma vivax]|uniref:Uncharacterized protein n=1 Tax=Trypanosoma vivax (strain Y486) TaxID=1055687 RepID=G0TYP3_TRYVY|nr:hypothetical protein TRVL_07701 [Trypanosoma vivax]KAH8611380.1 putative Complex 1 protein (LYR family) [Trypanosoma vivax]CCC49092.1 conserved hypothetical protein [Trypanosoma vivax Y486]